MGWTGARSREMGTRRCLGSGCVVLVGPVEALVRKALLPVLPYMGILKRWTQCYSPLLLGICMKELETSWHPGASIISTQEDEAGGSPGKPGLHNVVSQGQPGLHNNALSHRETETERIQSLYLQKLES